MTSLIPYQQGQLMVLLPRDWKRMGMVMCIPGSTGLYYEGPAAVALTPNALCICTSQGIRLVVHLGSISKVADRDFRGIIVEQLTSVGPILTAPRNAFGVEIDYETPSGMGGVLTFLVFSLNTALSWVGEINTAAYVYQKREMGHSFIHSRS